MRPVAGAMPSPAALPTARSASMGAVAVVRRKSGAAGGRITEAGVPDALFCGPAPPRTNPFAEVIIYRKIAFVNEASDGLRQLLRDASTPVRSQSNCCSKIVREVWPVH
ncbi:hypothetical protein GCM10023353_00100 [Tomitella cavernea]|uniref:Uncharacterized protein n=1 Tax=Tomitella cavernea TaxID=1387982 RepID=A0ABP9BZ79_9ACTN